MEAIIKELSKFGTVRTCKVIKEQVVTIVLTGYFTWNFTLTLGLLNKCKELFPEYPIVETCITEEDIAILVLTK